MAKEKNPDKHKVFHLKINGKSEGFPDTALMKDYGMKGKLWNDIL
jgi:hypothetical protein